MMIHVTFLKHNNYISVCIDVCVYDIAKTNIEILVNESTLM